MRIGFLFLLLASLFKSQFIFAYPQFIGFGYTSCLTCHSSPTGGGALNDYGRALFAVEIADKPFWFKNYDDEALSETSGFLGKPERLPFWIRPGIKYRRLVQTVNPGSTDEFKGDYRMQLDLNLNLFPDSSQTKGLIITASHLASPRAALPNKPFDGDEGEFAFREYFWRHPLSETNWVSAGFMDKAFGLKHADHTAFNRTVLPLAQNDQVHGVMFSSYRKSKEFHAFAHGGNLHLEEDDRDWGLTGLFEYEPVEKIRYGLSGLYQDHDVEPIYGLSAHTKVGLLDHSAWMLELGVRNQREWTPYLYSQISYLMRRGLYLEPTFQITQGELTGDGVHRVRAGLGLMYFPMQRLELRAQLIRAMGYQQDTVGASSWTMQTQVHLSL